MVRSSPLAALPTRPHERRAFALRGALTTSAVIAALLFAATDAGSQPRGLNPAVPLPVPLPQTPAIGECTQLMARGALKIDAVAVAKSPTSVELSWKGFPGSYVISGGLATTVQIADNRLLKTPRGAPPPAPQLEVASLTQTGALPDHVVEYAIRATLADGRTACGSAAVRTPPLPSLPTPMVPKTPRAPGPLSGWVDMHTHPMSNLAFGGLMFHGGPDVGSLLPRDAACVWNATARDQIHALGPVSICGDLIQQGVQLFTGASPTGGGAPLFQSWPRWDDMWHQKMWFEWIARARDGGLRVMVALSHNNATLANARGGPIAKDDVGSSDLQITHIKAFVGRHKDLMEIAKGASDIPRIVGLGKIAVVLGVELDQIGNFPAQAEKTSKAAVTAEIQRLFDQDVRYVFPVHLTDNAFGGAAVYDEKFNAANYLQSGALWTVECAPCSDEIGFKVATSTQVFHFGPGNIPAAAAPPTCAGPPAVPASCMARGHRNVRRLTELGDHAIREMMKRGMIVDIDHMSQRTAEDALAIAEKVGNGGYPVVSGHSAIRERNTVRASGENARSTAQLARIGKLGGMFGLGMDSIDAYDWARLYMQATTVMGAGRPGAVAFGTDTNSLVHAAKPPVLAGRTPVVYDASYPRSVSTANGPSRNWDYNVHGVAHYGMMSDFVRDLRTAPTTATKSVSGAALVDDNLNRSADYFWHMWERCESQRGNVR